MSCIVVDDVGQPGVAVRIDGNARPRELRLQILLAPVDRDEIRPEREDPLEVRIEQRPDPLEILHLRRVLVEAADADDLRSRANREQHLGERRHQRDDPLRPCRSLCARRGDECRDGQDGEE